MYKLKQKCSDFVVKEVFSPRIKKGDYTYFVLEKENYNTIDAIKTISTKLRIPMSRFGFAGNKDKKAVTSQYVSVKGLGEKKKEQLTNLNLKDIKISVLGQGDTPISLGDHSGNEFKIRITNLTTEDKLKLKQKLRDKKKIKFVDSFGEQRFGRNNVQVGKAILRRDWEKACRLVKNEDVAAHLKKHPKDFVNALRKIPKKTISIYIHSYQSIIWNKCSAILDVDKIPIVGFSTEFKDKVTEHHVLGLMKRDKITLKDFIIREIPNLYLEGDERNKYTTAHNVRLIEEGRDYAVIKFRLGTGSYATEFIRQLFE
jgi:tRNA pseudouridine13 synthase